MCCFSRDVRQVSNTRIFARLEKDRQGLAYAMNLSAAEELAMVLPLPTPPRSGKDALTFVSLEKVPTFFEDLQAGFPEPAKGRHGPPTLSAPAERRLEVERVGAFDASFVPSQADFARLDERFRIAPEVWAKMPAYADYGFAVFMLRKGEQQNVHPMALRFLTRHPKRVFFPTVHIHHGAFTPKADFDHALYLQFSDERRGGQDVLHGWTESPEPASRFVKIEQAQALVLGDQHVYRRELKGSLANTDTLVDLA